MAISQIGVGSTLVSPTLAVDHVFHNQGLTVLQLRRDDEDWDNEGGEVIELAPLQAIVLRAGGPVYARAPTQKNGRKNLLLWERRTS